MLFFAFTSNAQGVRTTVLNGDKLENHVKGHTKTQIVKTNTLPAIDIRAAKKRDTLEGRADLRYGVKINTNFTKEDGELILNNGMAVWKIRVQSKNAASLNFVLDNAVLPDGSEMYIYDKTETMVTGPITNEHIIKGTFATEIIKGDDAIFEVIMPQIFYEQFNLNIKSLVHGYQNEVLQTRAYDSSAVCTVDVNCPAGSGWTLQRDAVVNIFSGPGEWCSGALINNACQDSRGLILTADHCFDNNLTNWVVRFNYDSPNPTLPNCRGSEPTSWLSFNGVGLIAKDTNSDFMLVEMNWSLVTSNTSTFALAGWDNSTNIPSSTTGISHPKGDVKKILIDDQGPTLSGRKNGWPGTNYFKIGPDLGLNQGGSSGSPLFDNSSKRIVGNLWGGTFFCNSDPKWSTYGRISASWEGGGTSVSRLKDHLGSGLASPPSTTNTIRPIQPINGPDVICSSNPTTTLYTIPNMILGHTASWSISPTSLFATTGGAATSGTSSSALIKPNLSANGLATLTFTITRQSGCNSTTLTKQIWIGKPLPTFPLNNTVCKNAWANTAIPNPTLQGITSITWSYTGPINSFGSSFNTASFKGGPGTGSASVTATATNTCGTGSFTKGFGVINCGFIRTPDDIYRGILVSPNPVKDFVNISISLEEESILDNNKEIDYKLYDSFGKLIYALKSGNTYISLDVTQFKNGVYIIEAIYKNQKYYNKMMITK